MFFHKRAIEACLTLLSASALAVLSFLLYQPIEQVPELLQPIVTPAIATGVQIVLAILFFCSLALGFWRHNDPAPLIFGILGTGTLFLLRVGNLPSFLPAMCSACLLISGIWSTTRTTHISKREKDTPRLDDFLNTSLLPTDTQDDE